MIKLKFNESDLKYRESTTSESDRKIKIVIDKEILVDVKSVCMTRDFSQVQKNGDMETSTRN